MSNTIHITVLGLRGHAHHPGAVTTTSFTTDNDRTADHRQPL